MSFDDQAPRKENKKERLQEKAEMSLPANVQKWESEASVAVVVAVAADDVCADYSRNN